MPLDVALDARLFKALADPSRVHILLCLARTCEPRTVSQVAACCSIDLSVVSRHLALLRDAGVLEVHKSGREVRYAPRWRELAETLRTLAAAIDACCPPAEGGDGPRRQKRDPF